MTPDDEGPAGALFFDGSKFYGMTAFGEAHGAGMIFSLDLPEPSAGMLLVVGGIVRLLQRRRRALLKPA